MNNVILIGMPASGKSTVGVILAKILGYGFVDTDLLLQQREKQRLADIIRTRGVDRFLDAEGEVCRSLALSHTVIATGGSVIYRQEAMEHLRDLGTVVYLRVGLDRLEQRLSDMRQRGVALKEGQSLADLFRERTALYEKYAHSTVDEADLSLEETVRLVLSQLPQ